MPDSTPSYVVDQLWLYPIKSCKGIALETSRYGPEGLEYDRRWMIVDERTKKACTGRQFPKMVLIKPSIGTDNKLNVLIPAVDSAPCTSFNLPLLPDTSELAEWESFDDLGLWSLTLGGISPPREHEANIKLSNFFGRPVRIVQRGPGVARAPGKKAPNETTTGYGPSTTIYADTYPLHIISMPTILDLAQSLYDFQNRPQDKPCPEFRTDPGSIVQRFRPNIVISTSSHTSSDNTSSKMSAYEEDHWSQIEIGEGDVQVVGRCGRCTLPNMDPVTGTRHPTLPLTLLNAQRPKELDEFVGMSCPTLGIYAVPLARGSLGPGQGVWKVGDSVVVRSRVERSQEVGG